MDHVEPIFKPFCILETTLANHDWDRCRSHQIRHFDPNPGFLTGDNDYKTWQGSLCVYLLQDVESKLSGTKRWGRKVWRRKIRKWVREKPGSLEQGVRNPTRSVYGTDGPFLTLIPPPICISVLFISTYIGFVNYTKSHILYFFIL